MDSIQQKYERDVFTYSHKCISEIEAFLHLKLPLSQRMHIGQYVRDTLSYYKTEQQRDVDRTQGKDTISSLEEEILLRYFAGEYGWALATQLQGAYARYLENDIPNFSQMTFFNYL